MQTAQAPPPPALIDNFELKTKIAWVLIEARHNHRVAVGAGGGEMSEEDETWLLQRVLQERLGLDLPVWVVAKEKRLAELYGLLSHMVHETEVKFGGQLPLNPEQVSSSAMYQLGLRLMESAQAAALAKQEQAIEPAV